MFPHDPRELSGSSTQPTAVAVEEPDDLAAQLRQRLDRLRDQLLADRGADSHWTGTLSASALSTATAVSALAVLLRHSGPAETIAGFPRSQILDAVRRGRAWLDTAQNADGGLGDTDRSPSNIATTYLAVAAWRLSRPWTAEGGPDPSAPLTPPVDVEPQEARAQAWIEAAGGLDGLRRRYGTDKTFVVPIMTNGALAGIFDWQQIPALPFEAAAFPQSMYRLLRLPVVSYAIPALVAIGQARHHFAPSALLPLRFLRSAVRRRTLGVLRQMQPESGGYLEAAPLTSFVVMSLSAIGHHDHPVVRAGVRFLIDSMAEEGSWPIDTNLATWVTSLSIMALRCDPLDKASWFTPQLAEWLLDCQHRQRHPYTGAAPGGWGWTDLSGAVPDGDDTPAALLALASCRTPHSPIGATHPPHSPEAPIGATHSSGGNGGNGATQSSAESAGGHGPHRSVAGDIHSAKPSESAAGDGCPQLALPGGGQPARADTVEGGCPQSLSLGTAKDGWPQLAAGNGGWPQSASGRGAAGGGGSPRLAEYVERFPQHLQARLPKAVEQGAEWLLGLQNRDGGWPTFCRGWGRLPFDRSSTDLTAHALRALHAWRSELPRKAAAIERATRRGLGFLRHAQRSDGSWLPLWFGNHDQPDDENPVYGTSRVLLALAELRPDDAALLLGTDYLLAAQNADGGWGGGPSRTAWLQARQEAGEISLPLPRPEAATTSSVEETAVALEALVAAAPATQTAAERAAASEEAIGAEASTALSPRQTLPSWPAFPAPEGGEPPGGGREARLERAILRGSRFLAGTVDAGHHEVPWPIGFYFAKLWYHERLYPLVFAVGSLGRVVQWLDRRGRDA